MVFTLVITVPGVIPIPEINCPTTAPVALATVNEFVPIVPPDTQVDVPASVPDTV